MKEKFLKFSIATSQKLRGIRGGQGENNQGNNGQGNNSQGSNGQGNNGNEDPNKILEDPATAYQAREGNRRSR